MANTQLVEYIKNQLAAGVSKDAVTSALHSAGWSDGDVTDAVALAAVPASASAATPAGNGEIKLAVTDMQSFTPSKMFADVAIGKKAADTLPQEKKETVKAAPASAMSAAVSAASASGTVSTSPIMGSRMPGFASKFSFKREWLWLGISAVVAIASLAAAAYFYKSNADISAQLSAAQANAQQSQSDLNTKVAGLTEDKAALSGKLTAAEATAKKLQDELSFFLVPSGSATGTPLSADLTGTLTASGRSFTLATDGGIVVTVKNAYDAQVRAALVPLAGQGGVEITGTHLPGSREITVTAVNGASVTAPSAPPAAPAAASSTPAG